MLPKCSCKFSLLICALFLFILVVILLMRLWHFIKADAQLYLGMLFVNFFIQRSSLSRRKHQLHIMSTLFLNNSSAYFVNVIRVPIALH